MTGETCPSHFWAACDEVQRLRGKQLARVQREGLPKATLQLSGQRPPALLGFACNCKVLGGRLWRWKTLACSRNLRAYVGGHEQPLEVEQLPTCLGFLLAVPQPRRV